MDDRNRGRARTRGGTLRTTAKQRIQNLDTLSVIAAPGANRVARMINADPSCMQTLTSQGARIAVISDGTGLAPLGNLGARPALPIVEGTAAIYASLTDLNAVPLVVDTHSIETLVSAITALSPNFAAVHLEGIGAPRCFAIEELLIERAEIPILNADQHATAVTILAALTNALALVDKRIEEASRVAYHHAELARLTNRRGRHGTLNSVLPGTDVFIGLSAPNTLNAALVALMATDPIVFALASPEPEVNPKRIASTAAIVATSLSQYRNQLHKAYAFPGLMRGMIDAGVARLDTEQALAAASALARANGHQPSPVRLLPDLFAPDVRDAISRAVVTTANAQADQTRVR